MSKFDYATFYGADDDLAVSKEKYTKEQAIKIARAELGHRKQKYLCCRDGYVRHRAGLNEDYEPCVGWWLEYSEHKRSCPCWVFHTSDNSAEWLRNGYEVFPLQETEFRRAPTASESEAPEGTVSSDYINPFYI